jgi:hypothetical protein
MKKLPAYIMVIALLVMNFASIAHAECTEGMVCGGVQASASVDHTDDQNQDDSQKQAACDCCASGHHHHSHASIATGKAEHIMVSSKTLHAQEGENYFSQLHYPPSKPPKA